MNRRGEGFITKGLIGVALFGLMMLFSTGFIVMLYNEYDRPYAAGAEGDFGSVNTDLTALQLEAQEIQQGSGLDSDATDLAQVQGVLSASEKQADVQTIITDSLTTIRNIIPFEDYVFTALMTILSVLTFSAIVYVFLARKI